MSMARRMTAALAAFMSAGIMLVAGGCDLAQVLASGYMPLGYYNSINYASNFPFTATPYTPGFTSEFDSGVTPPFNTTIPTFNTMPGVAPGTGTIPDLGYGSGMTGNDNLFNSLNGGTAMPFVPSSPSIPTLDGGMNSMFGGGSIFGPPTGNISAGF